MDEQPSGDNLYTLMTAAVEAARELIIYDCKGPARKAAEQYLVRLFGSGPLAFSFNEPTGN